MHIVPFTLGKIFSFKESAEEGTKEILFLIKLNENRKNIKDETG